MNFRKNMQKPQATLTLRHLTQDADGNDIVAKKKRGGLLGLFGLKKLDVKVVHGCVTDAYVALLVDDLQSSEAAHSLFKYHDSGTGVAAEATGDTTLGTPCGEARDLGTQIEGATANIYKSVATHTYAGTFAITEHGLFSAASGGTLLDRTLFSVVNVVNGEKIEFTYELTVTSGG